MHRHVHFSRNLSMNRSIGFRIVSPVVVVASVAVGGATDGRITSLLATGAANVGSIECVANSSMCIEVELLNSARGRTTSSIVLSIPTIQLDTLVSVWVIEETASLALRTVIRMDQRAQHAFWLSCVARNFQSEFVALGAVGMESTPPRWRHHRHYKVQRLCVSSVACLTYWIFRSSNSVSERSIPTSNSAKLDRSDGSVLQFWSHTSIENSCASGELDREWAFSTHFGQIFWRAACTASPNGAFLPTSCLAIGVTKSVLPAGPVGRACDVRFLSFEHRSARDARGL